MKALHLLVFLLPLALFSQSKNVVDFVKNTGSKSSSGIRLQVHEKKTVASVLMYPSYWIYKQFISSQDGAMCSFYPSCANYGLQALSQKGILGIFYSFDRVSRCHGIYPAIYHSHNSGLNSDAIH
ncbi:MAG: membrane protein insertion efficiency factor YidD [Bacteroidia bacterium]|nr:membrane protein insertion efficiency factor YidD [Bacteroidia bacterium]